MKVLLHSVLIAACCLAGGAAHAAGVPEAAISIPLVSNICKPLEGRKGDASRFVTLHFPEEKIGLRYAFVSMRIPPRLQVGARGDGEWAYSCSHPTDGDFVMYVTELTANAVTVPVGKGVEQADLSVCFVPDAPCFYGHWRHPMQEVDLYLNKAQVNRYCNKHQEIARHAEVCRKAFEE